MKTKITEWIMAVVGMIFIISTAVIFTVAFRPLYYYDMKALAISQESGYPEDEIKANYDELIDYNLSPSHDKLEFPTFPMSMEAEIHFEEVKDIFQFFMKSGIICGVVSVLFLLYKIRKKNLRYLMKTGILTMVLPMVLGVFALINWEWLFVTFHKLVFQNDYWLFDPLTDPIIDCLPDTYFFHAAICIFLLIISSSVILILLGKHFRKGEE